MRILELERGALGDLNEFIQRAQQVGTAEDLLVGAGDFGLGTRVDRQRAVVLDAQRRDFLELFNIGEQSRVVHHSEGDARSALLELLFEQIEHLVCLFLGQRPVDAAARRCTG